MARNAFQIYISFLKIKDMEDSFTFAVTKKLSDLWHDFI